MKKAHKPGTVADSLRGLFETTFGSKRCVVEYEPDADLRDTEQVPLLEPGGIEAFIRREVLPHAPDAWYEEASIRTGYEISFNRFEEVVGALLLQTADFTHTGRNPCRHPGAGERDRGIAYRDRR